MNLLLDIYKNIVHKMKNVFSSINDKNNLNLVINGELMCTIFYGNNKKTLNHYSSIYDVLKYSINCSMIKMCTSRY